jgi:alcohol dehydrogenase class IV
LLAASCIGIAGFFMAVGAIPIHNLAHAVGGTFRIPHGEGNAVFIPIVMKNLAPLNQPRAKSFARAMGFSIDGLSEPEILGVVIDEIIALQKNSGISPKFSLEITAADLEKVHLAVKNDPAGLYFPIPDEVISACLKDAFVIK